VGGVKPSKHSFDCRPRMITRSDSSTNVRQSCSKHYSRQHDVEPLNQVCDVCSTRGSVPMSRQTWSRVPHTSGCQANQLTGVHRPNSITRCGSHSPQNPLPFHSPTDTDTPGASHSCTKERQHQVVQNTTRRRHQSEREGGRAPSPKRKHKCKPLNTFGMRGLDPPPHPPQEGSS
jgi:hypothetical protein